MQRHVQLSCEQAAATEASTQCRIQVSYRTPFLLVRRVPHPLSNGSCGFIGGKDAFARGSDFGSCLYKFCAIFAGVGTARHIVCAHHIARGREDKLSLRQRLI